MKMSSNFRQFQNSPIKKLFVCQEDTNISWLSVRKVAFLYVVQMNLANSVWEKKLNQHHHSENFFSLGGYEIRSVYAGYSHSLFKTRNGKLFSYRSNRFRELLLGIGHGENVYSPTETTITSGAAFCIAEDSLSIVFIDGSPPNALNIQIKQFK